MFSIKGGSREKSRRLYRLMIIKAKKWELACLLPRIRYYKFCIDGYDGVKLIVKYKYINVSSWVHTRDTYNVTCVNNFYFIQHDVVCVCYFFV